MACITLAAPLAMATTQLTNVAFCETASTWQPEAVRQRKPLHLSWVVVTDECGQRRLRMRWSNQDPQSRL